MAFDSDSKFCYNYQPSDCQYIVVTVCTHLFLLRHHEFLHMDFILLSHPSWSQLRWSISISQHGRSRMRDIDHGVYSVEEIWCEMEFSERGRRVAASPSAR